MNFENCKSSVSALIVLNMTVNWLIVGVESSTAESIQLQKSKHDLCFFYVNSIVDVSKLGLIPEKGDSNIRQQCIICTEMNH